MSKKSAYSEKRKATNDRRDKPTPAISSYALNEGSRQTPRRKEDRWQNYFVDRYSRRIFAVVLLILAMSLVDALFTLQLLNNGASEINPVMAHFLEYGPLEFLVAKYILTCASVLLLLIYKNVYLLRTRVRAKYLFVPILFMFSLVIAWEIFLIVSSN
ncbi:MAG: hypothetical protein H6696_05020 [Deferribacteres bacterium]|nr:hypothetical protein [candidate division KSB1 bacterium]MCB9501278.1 hypothetical protein [Deferribacteres bacterium]